MANTTKKLKNLANCTPSEFLKQTNKIRKAVSKWLTLTDIKNIRKRMPELKEGMTDEEIKKAKDEQGLKNFDAMLDSILDEHPDETLELLALASFVEPADVDKYTIDQYLESFNEIMNDETVLRFFTSLTELVNRFGL